MRSFIVSVGALGFFFCAASAALGQDAAAGEKVFRVCKACHQIGPDAHNAIGPVLTGVVGRKAGTYPGYNYSDANKKSGIVWTEDELKKYLQHPAAVVPGTKMTFAGLPKPSDIDNVIAYLKTFSPAGGAAAPASPAPSPTPSAAN